MTPTGWLKSIIFRVSGAAKMLLTSRASPETTVAFRSLVSRARPCERTIGSQDS